MRRLQGFSVVPLLAGIVACGPGGAGDGEACAAGTALVVAPEVVLEGKEALAGRVEGAIVVEEVLFHAPNVLLIADDAAADATHDDEDLLATDADAAGPLIFHLDRGLPESRGRLLGDTRRWQLPAWAENEAKALSFRFARFEDVDAVHALYPDVDLDALSGHVGVVSGWFALRRASGVQGSAAKTDVSKENTRTETDPETSPAQPGAETDPETSPARRDRGMGVAKAARRALAPASAGAAVEAIPFRVIVRLPFSREVPFADVTVGGGEEPAPIELHIDIDALFGDADVARLRDGAGVEGPVVFEAAAEASFQVRPHRAVAATGGRATSERAP